MGNSESACSPHEDGCKEVETKLKECGLAHLASKFEEVATKEYNEGYKATFNDEEGKLSGYMKRGACKESYLAYVKSTDKDFDDKRMTWMECMEAHSTYYHKFLDFHKGYQEKVRKEFKSINPFIKDDYESLIRVQEFLGDFCREQYSAFMKCCLRSSRGVDYFGSFNLFSNRDD